jgi:hypothetical protein
MAGGANSVFGTGKKNLAEREPWRGLREENLVCGVVACNVQSPESPCWLAEARISAEVRTMYVFIHAAETSQLYLFLYLLKLLCPGDGDPGGTFGAMDCQLTPQKIHDNKRLKPTSVGGGSTANTSATPPEGDRREQ